MKAKSHRKAKRTHAKTILRLPDLDIAKAAVINGLRPDTESENLWQGPDSQRKSSRSGTIHLLRGNLSGIVNMSLPPGDSSDVLMFPPNGRHSVSARLAPRDSC